MDSSIGGKNTKEQGKQVSGSGFRALASASASSATSAVNLLGDKLHVAMKPRGKLVAIEGIDGSGKRTQIELLARALTERGVPLVQMGFPRYDSFMGRMVGRFLDGDFGALEHVDPHFSALLYAGDRLEARPELRAALDAAQTILTDRYVASNLAHQTARVWEKDREDFLTWLTQLEYGLYALPEEDLVIYLRVPAHVAHTMVAKQSARDYTKRKRDIQESSVAHLEQAAAVYDALARRPNWATVECYDEANDRLRAPEEIHREVLAAVESRLMKSAKA